MRPDGVRDGEELCPRDEETAEKQGSAQATERGPGSNPRLRARAPRTKQERGHAHGRDLGRKGRGSSRARRLGNGAPQKAQIWQFRAGRGAMAGRGGRGSTGETLRTPAPPQFGWSFQVGTRTS